MNFVGSAAVPRAFSIASVASCAATTRLRVLPGHDDPVLEERGRADEGDHEHRDRGDDFDDGEAVVLGRARLHDGLFP